MQIRPASQAEHSMPDFLPLVLSRGDAVYVTSIENSTARKPDRRLLRFPSLSLVVTIFGDSSLFPDREKVLLDLEQQVRKRSPGCAI